MWQKAEKKKPKTTSSKGREADDGDAREKLGLHAVKGKLLLEGPSLLGHE